jgi:hypothetical protein
MMTLGLKNLVALNPAELADGTIDRANEVGWRQWPRPIF